MRKISRTVWAWKGSMIVPEVFVLKERRLAGWLLVSFGVTTIVIALFLPVRLITPVIGSLALAMLVGLLVKHRQLRTSRLAHRAAFDGL
jgi:hypothetical protein